MAHMIDAECHAVVTKLKDDMDVPILTRWIGIMKLLKEKGIVVSRPVHPLENFVHPDNRAGLGLNQYNVHKIIASIIHVRGDMSKLAGAACFEISTDPVRREEQIAFNLKLIAQSEGCLAPPSGKERSLTVGSGHTTAGCRAIIHGCTSHVKELTDDAGILSKEKACRKDPILRQMLEEGWLFDVIPAYVEEVWPDFPLMGVQALNASNNVATEIGELETAATIAEYADQLRKNGKEVDWEWRILNAKVTCPPCEPYINTIGKLVRLYGGGDKAPLIIFLDFMCKTFGANKKFGEDFLTVITDITIPSDRTKYPFIRASCISCNLTSTKIQIARFLLPAQIEKLKSENMKPKVDAAEEALAEAWVHTNMKIHRIIIDKANGFRVFGAFAARVTMHVFGNGEQGFEGREYKSLPEPTKHFE